MLQVQNLGLVRIPNTSEFEGYSGPVYYTPNTRVADTFRKKFQFPEAVDIVLLFGGTLSNFGQTYGPTNRDSRIRYRCATLGAEGREINFMIGTVELSNQTQIKTNTILGGKGIIYSICQGPYVRKKQRDLWFSKEY